MRFTDKIGTSDSDIVAYDTSSANIVELPDLVEGKRYTGGAIYKLGPLEDIEEKLGASLLNIMKAMLNGYYWKGIDGSIYHFPELDFIRKDTGDESPCRLNHYYWNHTGKYLEDYGKTWALNEEELS